MSKIKLAAAIMAMSSGLLAVPGVASAASIRPAESVYTTSYIERAFDRTDPNAPATTEVAGVYLQAYSTYSATQIWVNGHVACWGETIWSTPFNPPVPSPSQITWCGVGGGNGTAVLNIGVNWNVPSWNAYNLYERMDILANGGGCTTWGTNSPAGDIFKWGSYHYGCEASA
jgi:hypothetical protein